MFRWNQYVLREGELGDGGGQDPPEGDPPEPEVATIPVSVLPADLQGKSEVELKFILDRMATSVVQGNDTTIELRNQLAALTEQVNAAPVEPDPNDEVSDEDLIVSDPTAAVMRILKREGMTDRFAAVESRTGEGMLLSVGRNIPDFDEYEDDVRTIMVNTGVPMDDANIRGSYAMAVGLRAIKVREESARAAASMTDPPTPEIDTGGDETPLTGLEGEIFAASGMTRKEWDTNKSDDGPQVEVPLG